MASPPPLRVGVVSYLNMLPLTYGMELMGNAGEPIEVVSVPPAPMAEMMEQGRLDVGMLPVGAVIGREDWQIVGRSMIGADGCVKSVLAVGRGAPPSWKRLHPDSHSRTSNLLSQVLLAGRYGNRPVLADPIPMEGWSPPEAIPEGEAYVLIGTKALRWGQELSRRGVTVLDLGQSWKEWTGLPFVFAVWAARRGVDLDGWMDRFEALKRENMGRLDRIIATWPLAENERLTPDEARVYLTENIRFDLDERALAGLERFYEEGRKLGVFPPGWELRRVLRRD